MSDLPIPGRKILVVDDEQDIRALIRFPLQRRGFTVIEGTNGEEAVTLARQELPALILLDVMMPRVDGLTACQQLRDDPITQGIPIVFLSARGQASDISAGLAGGADAYLVKPFQTAELLALVARFAGPEHTLEGRL